MPRAAQRGAFKGGTGLRRRLFKSAPDDRVVGGSLQIELIFVKELKSTNVLRKLLTPVFRLGMSL